MPTDKDSKYQTDNFVMGDGWMEWRILRYIFTHQHPEPGWNYKYECYLEPSLDNNLLQFFITYFAWLVLDFSSPWIETDIYKCYRILGTYR